MRLFLIGLVITCHIGFVFSYPHPIGFSIPESKIVKEIPNKDKDFASLIPGDTTTYIFDNEEDYYKGYQRAFFAITKCKGGWDCLRHYEILANGCIPYFLDLEQCEDQTMFFLPKDLILEAMQLEGVSLGQIDHSLFDKERYFAILKQLLDYTRAHLTTKAMASYLLKVMGYSGQGKILFLSKDIAPDYMRCTILSGLKELLGDKVVDYPKIPHIYKNYSGDLKQLYGRGFSYTKLVDDPFVRRNPKTIKDSIHRRDYELIIYGSVHRGMLWHDLVERRYNDNKIAYICGEDFHKCEYSHFRHFFLREFSAIGEK